MNWDYLQPVKIHFGKGRVKEIKEIARELGCERGLLVAGPFFFKSRSCRKGHKRVRRNDRCFFWRCFSKPRTLQR